MTSRTKKIIVRSICFPIISVIMLILVAINFLAFSNATIISGMIGKIKVEQSEENISATKVSSEALAEEIQGEGVVLLKNDNSVLPLAKENNKVNVFGWSSTQWVGSGSGSGGVSSVEVDFLTALSNAGISYNEEITGMYNDFLNERPFASVGTLNSLPSESCRLYEPSISDNNYYTNEMLVNAKEYSDTAIVVLGRFAGESSDCPKIQYKVTEKNGEITVDENRTYLDLSSEEEELLSYVGENYDKVIVLVNSPNTMSLGAVESISGIDSCMLVGVTGSKATAIPKLLYGDITPSGKTVDTYAYDFSTAAVYANSGETGVKMYTNGAGLYPADGETTNGNVGTNPLYEGVSYVDYVEDIYIGYKWYETAYEQGFWNQISNQYGEGYEGVVQYPFGYGLSYTSFKWDILNAYPEAGAEISKDSEISITVRVTNVGDVEGKDVVELYYNPPYKEGGIEKSSSNLCAFEKTKLLQPGESQEVVLKFKVEDMASYDCYDKNENGFSGYELDMGNYEIKVMKNAHEVSNAENSVINYQINDSIKYSEDSVTGSMVENKFTAENSVDGISLDGSDSEANIMYLSRSDFEGTFPKVVAPEREMTDNIKELNLYTEEMAQAWIDTEDEDVVTGKNNNLKLYENNKVTELGLKLGGDYDNEKWEDVLDQLTITEMEELVLHGYTRTENVNSVGKPLTKEVDGPSQIGSFAISKPGTGFSNSTVMAQTWNDDLAYEFGLAVAKEASNLGYSGWYAPSVNMHRSAFGGRNYEYYSEDSFISGKMAARTVEGSLDGGVYCYVKHYAVYDQDTNRDSLYTWMTEQALREIYLKPFKIIIQEGGATGMMTAYNRIGAVWTGGSTGLIEIARNEWGFKGAIITDYSDHHKFMNMDQALRAGGDVWMDGAMSNGVFKYETESNSFKQELRRASKNILYMWLNANYENASYNETAKNPIVKPVMIDKTNSWIKIIVAVDIVSSALLFLWIRALIKPAKDKEIRKK